MAGILRKHWALLILLLLTFLTYSNSLNHPFTYLDDQEQLVQNPNVRSLDWISVKAIFSSTAVGMYQPLTTLIYALIYSLAGIDPFAFHLSSLILHLLNTLLLFGLLKKLKIEAWSRLILCAIFALHPMQVESVSWVSAFSNLVFSNFYFLSLHFYLSFKKDHKTILFWMSLILFLFSCLAKSTAVSLPLILIILDYYLNGRITVNDLIRKIPFLLLSIIFGIITIFSREAAGHLSELSAAFNWFDRIFLIAYSVLFYPLKFLLPIKLSAFYPYPAVEGNLLPIAFYLAFIGVIISGFLIWKYRQHKKLWLGAIFYLITIAPTLHFIPVGNQLTTDRYLYLPIFGLLILMGVVFDRLSVRLRQIILPLLAIALAWMSFERSKIWESDKAIWKNVIKNHPGVAQAYNNLGSYQLMEGNKKAAFENFDRAIELKPYYADAYNNRGNIYSQAGKSEQAMDDFNRALELRPHADAYFNRANELSKSGNFKLAIEDYSASLDLKASADAFTNRAYAFLRIGNKRVAIQDLQAAIKLQKDYHRAYFLRSMIAREENNFEEACKFLDLAARYGNQKARSGYPKLCPNN